MKLFCSWVWWTQERSACTLTWHVWPEIFSHVEQRPHNCLIKPLPTDFLKLCTLGAYQCYCWYSELILVTFYPVSKSYPGSVVAPSPGILDKLNAYSLEECSLSLNYYLVNFIVYLLRCAFLISIFTNASRFTMGLLQINPSVVVWMKMTPIGS